MRSRRALLAFVLVMMLAGAACSGPNIPLKVGVKEFPTDVILGNQVLLPPPAPPPAGNLEPGFPIIVPPSGVQIIDEAGPPAACPAAGEFAAPSLAAEGRAFDPPKEATYAFRNGGGFLEVGPTPSNGSFPAISTRTIIGVQTLTPNIFTYAIISKVGDVTTRTQYLVISRSDTPTTAPYGGPGMYINQIVIEDRGSTDSFTPTPPLKILEFPIQAGATWSTRGVDGSRGTAMGWTARVGREVPDGEDEEREGGVPVNAPPPVGVDKREGDPAYNPDNIPKVRVNACGDVIDAWYITITDGSFVDSANSKSQTFTSLYKFAPQFGGIFVGESVHTDGFEGESAFVRNFESTINEVPAVP
ncbi:MAG TPA: hypothetical protein VND22_02150 [Actinomycetota bacterium]|nr:hypothetical protein [Actinomycetota bacterium]